MNLYVFFLQSSVHFFFSLCCHLHRQLLAALGVQHKLRKDTDTVDIMHSSSHKRSISVSETEEKNLLHLAARVYRVHIIHITTQLHTKSVKYCQQLAANVKHYSSPKTNGLEQSKYSCYSWVFGVFFQRFVRIQFQFFHFISWINFGNSGIMWSGGDMHIKMHI